MSGQIVLVLAQAQDETANLVVDALLARGADVARIDTADFPGSLSLAATPERIDSPGWLRSHGRRIDLASVSSVYRRHPAHFIFPSGMSDPERLLECNPAGQWGWIAEQTGLPIAEAIADELVGAP